MPPNERPMFYGIKNQKTSRGSVLLWGRTSAVSCWGEIKEWRWALVADRQRYMVTRLCVRGGERDFSGQAVRTPRSHKSEERGQCKYCRRLCPPNFTAGFDTALNFVLERFQLGTKTVLSSLPTLSLF